MEPPVVSFPCTWRKTYDVKFNELCTLQRKINVRDDRTLAINMVCPEHEDWVISWLQTWSWFQVANLKHLISIPCGATQVNTHRHAYDVRVPVAAPVPVLDGPVRSLLGRLFWRYRSHGTNQCSKIISARRCATLRWDYLILILTHDCRCQKRYYTSSVPSDGTTDRLQSRARNSFKSDLSVSIMTLIHGYRYDGILGRVEMLVEMRAFVLAEMLEVLPLVQCTILK